MVLIPALSPLFSMKSNISLPFLFGTAETAFPHFAALP